jgi:hypothetical protein
MEVGFAWDRVLWYLGDISAHVVMLVVYIAYLVGIMGFEMNSVMVTPSYILFQSGVALTLRKGYNPRSSVRRGKSLERSRIDGRK